MEKIQKTESLCHMHLTRGIKNEQFKKNMNQLNWQKRISYWEIKNRYFMTVIKVRKIERITIKLQHQHRK